MSTLLNFVLHFQELISQIRAQKKTVLTLNITGQKFISASPDAAKIASLKQRIKVIIFIVLIFVILIFKKSNKKYVN